MVFETSVRVRFRDTDMYGHVNNSSYATYAEEARIAFMEEQFGGFTPPLILAKANYTFLHQTKFPDHRDIKAKVWFSRIGNSSADMETRLLAMDGTALCDTTVTVVHFDYKTQKASAIPDDVRTVLKRYLYEDEKPNV
ncbi:acyl-CoA thioesterase [Alicyclobacillus dauci]|uniref:Acyl-CoA thioesterase n=1 Tax=Alicyclobacillus dauci TaxID=1475485 RepID=A0ABY6YYQ6_9BACL|nr:thioesterase family protein [Alicyclobacillus dauci]WAH35749.1 acyl-CoA thioesterase [Alicyclobacillus dauci]